MSILDQLSSQAEDRTSAANKRAAAQVLEQPALLEEIAGGMASSNAKLAGDCAEVMTFVAADHPELVAPYADALIAQREHKDTRVRWETMHSLAEIAATVPDKIAPIVPGLVEQFAHDKSIIVRDYAILTLGEYGGTSHAAALNVWPHLRNALAMWDSRHAGKVMEAMIKVVAAEPLLKTEAQALARQLADHQSAKVRTLAKRLVK
jgi:ribosomal protein RSM22 (predicted rRNA methylase)